MVQEVLRDLKHIDASPRQRVRFGLVMTAALSIAALVFYLKTGNFSLTEYALLSLAVGFAAGTLFAPRTLYYPYLFWMSFAIVIGSVIGFLLLIALFYLLVTPIGLFMRMLGKDPLDKSFKSSRSSYWISRERSKTTDLEHPF